MASGEAFADTSALYAAVDARDAHHLNTALLMRQLAQAGRMIVTSDYVIAETLNLAVARRGRIVADRLLQLLRRPPVCERSGLARSDSSRPKRSSANTPITIIPLPIAPVSLSCASCEFAMP